jgi:hypothetical protein
MRIPVDSHDISAVKDTTHASPPRNMLTTVLVSPSPHMVAQAPAFVGFFAETGLKVIVMSQQVALEEAISEHVLVVAPSSESEAAEYHQRCDVICRSRRWSWLRAVMSDSGSEFQVGPLFTAESVPCYTCAAKRFPKMTSNWNNELVAARETALNVFTAWLAETVSRICGGVLLLNGEFVICKFPGVLTYNRVAIRDRQCAACGGSRTTDSTSTAYQQAVEMLQDYFNMAGSRIRNRYFGEDHRLDTGQIRKTWNYDENLVLLPYVEASKPTRVFGMLSSLRRRSAASLTLKDIASMLRYSAGYRAVGTVNRLGRRWCASAGNKGSVTLQIDVRGIPAIADGLYLYRDANHALEPLSTRNLPQFCVDLHLGGPAPLRSERKYEITVIGNYERLYGKYGIFASKLVYLDIGVATAQLLRYAFGLNMKPQFQLTANRWHVETGIVPFSRRPSVLVRMEPSAQSQEENDCHANETKRALVYADESFDKSSPREIEQFILSYEFANAQLHSSSGTEGRWWDGLTSSIATRSKNLTDVFSQRKSLRQFSGKPIMKDIALSVIKEALLFFATCAGVAIRSALTLLVSFDKVSGISCGQYLCCLDPEVLKCTAIRSDSAPIVEGGAAFRCLVMGRSDSGQCTYSQQLILAGMLIHFIALEATANGLAGSIVARGESLQDLVSHQEARHDLVLCSYICGLALSENGTAVYGGGEESNG